MKDHDIVWHLAANTDIIGVEKPSRDLNDCVIGTFNILESMRKLDIKNIIFSSTGAVYGDLCLDVATSEEGGTFTASFYICRRKDWKRSLYFFLCTPLWN